MSSLHLVWPSALWGLALLPLFWATAGRGRRARLAAAVRSLASVLVLLALAGLRVETTQPASGTCVLAAVDRSASVEQAAAEAARAFVARLAPLLGPDDLLGALVFGADARVVAYPVPRPALDALDPERVAVDASDTDLAAVLAGAAALCPEGRQAALLLFTDGNETTGSVLAEAAWTVPRVPVFPVVPPARTLPPVTVRRLLAPRFAPAHTVLPLEAVVENHAGARLTAALKVTANGRPVGGEPDGRSARLQFVELPPGVSLVALAYRLSDPGQYLLEAELLLAPGIPPAPGPTQATITVTPAVRALVVSERPAPVVAAALEERGMDVSVVGPPAFTAAGLAGRHVVVLDDVGRAGLGDGALAALARWVGAGGALLVTGGEHLFGDPGLATSPLARVLPVELVSQAPEPREREPIALYLLVDRSNSMGYSSGPAMAYGDKMEYAKRAALAVLEQLGDGDLVGAIAFDSQPYELAPLRPAREVRAALAGRIRQLQYGGGTDFKDALALAFEHLSASPRRVRHVILLTDGDTNRRAEDHRDLVAALANVEITVTTIRIGSDTVNLQFLSTISRATGGQFHHVERVQALPQLLISDTRRQIDLAAGREGVPVRVGEPGPLLAGLAEADLPPLARWAITRPRPGAEVRLYVDTGERQDPILATWQHGLGHVAVLPLDFQAAAASWAAWGGFGKLWAQLVLWAIPEGLSDDRHLEAERTRAGTLLRLTTIADEPGPVELAVEGGGATLLHPTAPRRFAALVPPLSPGPHAATLRVGEAAAEPVDLVVPAPAPSARERRATGSGAALLARLAALTGGRVNPTPEDVLVARAGATRRTIPLDAVLVPLALVLVLADVAARRGLG